jgi:hypothetical protein
MDINETLAELDRLAAQIVHPQDNLFSRMAESIRAQLQPTPPEPSGDTQFTTEERDYLLSFIRHDLSERTSVNGTFDQSIPWGDGNFMRQSLIQRLEALAPTNEQKP